MNTDLKNFQTSCNIAEVEVTYKTKVKNTDRLQIKNSSDTYTVLKDVWSNKIEFVEEFVLLLLNRANKVLGWVKISQGGVSGTLVDPKVIFSIALQCNASGLILSHNHSSGNLQPSQADINLTRQIKEGGKLLEINVIDHIIITSESYFSFADEGLM